MRATFRLVTSQRKVQSKPIFFPHIAKTCEYNTKFYLSLKRIRDFRKKYLFKIRLNTRFVIRPGSTLSIYKQTYAVNPFSQEVFPRALCSVCATQRCLLVNTFKDQTNFNDQVLKFQMTFLSPLVQRGLILCLACTL